MSKADSLLSRMGGGLAESIGLRSGQSAIPVYQTATSETPKTDFIRNRSVGEIHPSEVMPDPDQPRKFFDEDEIARLSADIQQRGQLQPIRVRWSGTHGKWLIIAGERRWRAVTAAKLEKITCIFIDREMSENEIRTEQLVENLLRENLTGIEEAKAYRSLMDANKWSATELATGLNVSKGKVSKALALLKLPEDLQAQIEAGKISPSTAYELSKAKTDEQRSELAQMAATGNFTQEDAAKATKKKAEVTGKRRSTNESFQTSDKVKVVITARRDIGDAGMIQALIEVAETIRKRAAEKGKKAA